MGFFTSLFRSKESNIQWQEKAQELIRESQNTIDEAKSSLVRSQELMEQTRVAANLINGVFGELNNFKTSKAASLPISVQPYPVVDDMTYEGEKQLAMRFADPYFKEYEEHFIGCLNAVNNEVLQHNVSFFKNLDNAAETSNSDERQKYLKSALSEVLTCSPKKIMSEFQKGSLEAGWAYVSGYNMIIDELARLFPRCRAGIFASRLKYSDVIQISDEILTTLRSCQTLMEDLQRRYEILESLQNHIQADLLHTECEKIMEAFKETFADNKRYELEENSNFFKKIGAKIMQPITALGDIASLPALQIQGQMQRQDRSMVFLATADMFREGWVEWQETCESVIAPNLRVMFELKRDFFKNQLLCILDTASYNGYDLKNFSGIFTSKFLSEK